MKRQVSWPVLIMLGVVIIGILLAIGASRKARSLGTTSDDISIALTQQGDTMPERIEKSEAEWRKLLSKEQYHVMRERGTERAFAGQYHNFKRQGIYLCSACGNELFSSDTKYDSGTGWPSFYQPLRETAVETEADLSGGMVRVAVNCALCGSHLGHLFEDGPLPTGKRYCLNSVCLKFVDSGPSESSR